MEVVETVITLKGIECQQHGLISGIDCSCLKDISKCANCPLFTIEKEESES
jgi:hypothetical protein